MNPLNSIKMHLKGLERAYGEIKTEETRKKAGGMIREGVMKWGGVEMPVLTDSVTVGSGGEVLRVAVGGDGEEAVKAGETGSVTVLEGVEEMIGGWPAVAEIVACGLAPNRRHNRGRLPDGRVVSIERGLGLVWRDGSKYRCRLVRAGGAPLFRAVA